jgi:hypothetical protein
MPVAHDPLGLYGGSPPVQVSVKRIMAERVLVPVTLASIAYLLGFWHGRKTARPKSAT